MPSKRDAAVAVVDPPIRPYIPEAAPAAAGASALPASDAPLCPYHPGAHTVRESPVRSVLRRYHCPEAGCPFSINLPLVGMQHARRVEIDVPMPR